MHADDLDMIESLARLRLHSEGPAQPEGERDGGQREMAVNTKQPSTQGFITHLLNNSSYPIIIMAAWTDRQGTVLGPLTTAWPMPDSCTVHVVHCPTCTEGFRGQQ
jgi:hypothetical protein